MILARVANHTFSVVRNRLVTKAPNNNFRPFKGSPLAPVFRDNGDPIIYEGASRLVAQVRYIGAFV